MWRKEFGNVQYHYAEDPEGISGCDTVMIFLHVYY